MRPFAFLLPPKRWGSLRSACSSGELWTVADLLAGMMVRSGNDAAMALAEHVGGRRGRLCRPDEC